MREVFFDANDQPTHASGGSSQALKLAAAHSLKHNRNVHLVEAAEDPERALIARAKAGDHPSFQRLYNTHANAIGRYLHSKLRNATAVDDALAETFRTAFEKLDTFKGERPFVAWLRSIAYTKAIDILRVNKKDGWEPLEIDDSDDDKPAIQPACTDDIERTLDIAKNAAKVQAVVAKIKSETQRRAMQLVFIDGLARDQAALLLGLTLPSMHVIMNRALDAFEAIWKDMDR